MSKLHRDRDGRLALVPACGVACYAGWLPRICHCNPLIIRNFSRALLLLALAVFANLASAQSPPLIRKRVGEVRLTLVATDRDQHPLPRLSPSEISILDEGSPVPHFDLRPAGDLPLRLALVLDLSGSMQKFWLMARESLLDSLRQLLKPGDQMLVLAFSSKIELQRTLTESAQLDAILQISHGGSLTALYDALYRAAGDSIFDAGTEPRRRALILFSDGEDNLSIHGLSETIARAERKGLSIYTLASHSHHEISTGDAVLQSLAESTGGRDFVVRNVDQTRSALATIQQELRSSFLLFYRTPADPAPNGSRQVQVLPAPGSGLRVRSRQRYFTDP